MTFTSAELSAWIGAFIWPFARIGALVGIAPVLGSRIVPVRIRLGLALALTAVVAPLVPAPPALDALSAPGVLVMAQQVLIGLAMGFALRMTFGALDLAGQTIGQLMGLGFASMLDPQNGVQVPVVSQFYTLLALLLFLAFNGHLVLIEVLVASFHTLPVGAALGPDGLWTLAGWAGQMFAGAVLIALPAIAALVVVNLALGVITRAAPQLNIFAVGFPATLLLGFVVMLVALPGFSGQWQLQLEGTFEALHRLLGGR
jgi:flagellar biosynthetic protein FliR